MEQKSQRTKHLSLSLISLIFKTNFPEVLLR